MNSKRIIGNLGEEFAISKLKKLGYQIISTNYSCRYGEIDIIAIDKEEIAFVEVKVRKINSIQSPAQAVNKSKRNKIIKTAEDFLQNNNLTLYSRFDVFEIYLNKNEEFKVVNYEYIQNAFDTSDCNF